MTPDADWAKGLTAAMPASWASKLLNRWNVAHREDRTKGNLEHLRTCKKIKQAQAAGVRADANDDDLVQQAKDSARDATRRIDAVKARARGMAAAVVLSACLWAVQDWLEIMGLDDAWERLAKCKTGKGALMRVQCDRWWRRVLRRVHAQAVEGTARAIGLVHKRAGCYVSNDALKRRRGQVARNAAALESVVAVNERAQQYTLAELAAKGQANKEIRRHELMTRIAGFELIAKDCGHEAYFVTVTCPSRMHAYRTAGHGVEKNPRYDGTKPDEAQAYLSKQWSKARAAAQRAGLHWYGFRIAEPNHDGTPHWHALFFFPKVTDLQRVAYRVLVRILRRYFLHTQDPGERGARKHRVKLERIDWTRGSAAGYVAKYVAKNVDGFKVEKDLYGNEAITASQRVEAWASTWRVRQFQQIGGAPVTVWREIRRLHPDQAEASALVGQGLAAANIASQADGHHSESVQRFTAATGWARYTALQGGPTAQRSAQAIRLETQATGELGRYGELVGPRVVGVVATDTIKKMLPPMGIILNPVPQIRRVTTVVESERCDWIIVPKGDAALAVQRMTPPAQAEGMRPWSTVNNCTRADWLDHHPAPLFEPNTRRVPKLGRPPIWNRGRSKEKTDETTLVSGPSGHQ